MGAPQKPKSSDTVYHPDSTYARDGRTLLADPGKQVTRTISQSGNPTLMADIVRPGDAVEPTWSDRHPLSADLTPTLVIPGSTSNGQR
jgi:hypothetical protein